MRKSILSVLAAALLCLASCTPENEVNPDIKGEADVMFVGNIITMDKENPRAEAMTVKSGKVQYVGTLDEARKYCGDRTDVREYPKAYIYPGFLEGHLHGMEVASRFDQVNLAAIDDDLETTMDDFVALMAQDVKEHPDRKIYKGAGWSVKFDVLPTAAMLDPICPDVPMVLSSVDGHSMWINTCAIKKYGVDKNENIEKYGTDCIHIDGNGFPTGYISENAMELVRPALLLSKEELKTALLKWQDIAFSYGITGVVEAAITTDGVEKDAWMELAKAGIWKLRTYAMECVQDPMPDEKFWGDLNKVLEHHKQYQNEYFQVYGVKIFVDGVVEAHTAWLLESYDDDPTYYGKKSFPDPNRIAEAVEFANKNGMNVHFHTIGDGAIRTAVEGIIKGQQAAGVTDARNTMAHLQIIKPEDIKKMADNNIIPVCAPLWCPIDPEYVKHEIEYLGLERVNSEYRVRSFFDAGCKVNFHSDYPVSPSISMPLTIYAAVKRTIPFYGEAGIQNPTEAVTVQQALEAMTVNVAWQLKEENRLGQLKSGMIANLSICDVDFLNAPIENVADAKVVATYVDGVKVFGE